MTSCSLTIVGDGSVGKSTITSAFKDQGFIKVYKQTIGVDFYEKMLKVRDNLMVSLKVWDVGGQSIQSKNLKSYLAHSDVVLLIYDVTNAESFGNLDDWLQHVRNYAKEGCIKYVVGNKVDLIALRQVTVKQHEAFISQNNDLAGRSDLFAILFINGNITIHIINMSVGGLFVSAKTGENVVKTFFKVAAEAAGVHLSGECSLTTATF